MKRNAVNRARQAGGFVAYDGPSLLDGAPIVAVVTLESDNRKTGNMPQAWILRSRISPTVAVASGRDRSICGDCPHRGEAENGKGRACYVTVCLGPTSVYKRYRRGGYARGLSLAEQAEVLDGQTLRLGAYGDPAAVPVHVWQALTSYTGKRTGYTHQWKDCDPRLRRFCVASVDNPVEYAQATAAGWRTFRIRKAGGEFLPGEIACPASSEAGSKTQCERCGLCDGARSDDDKRRNLAIVVHGTGARAFRE